jgi:hypothetical protein
MHGRTIGKFPPHLNRRTEGVNEMPEYAPVSTTFLDGQVMVLCEMSTVLTSRIYKNSAQRSASGAVFPSDEWSIPLLDADFLHLTSKSVEHSRYLPVSPVANDCAAHDWGQLLMCEGNTCSLFRAFTIRINGRFLP